MLCCDQTYTNQARIRDRGEWSNFTILVGTTPFPVHRVK